MDELFRYKEFFLKEIAKFKNIVIPANRFQFIVKITSFKIKDTIGNGIIVFIGYQMRDQANEPGQRGNRPADYKIIFSVMFLQAHVLRRDVFQPDLTGNASGDDQLFRRAVDKVEMDFREKDRQRDPGEPASRAGIQDLRTRPEFHDFADGQRMQHMALVKVANILPRYHVDLFVPIAVKRTQLHKLSLLSSA